MHPHSHSVDAQTMAAFASPRQIDAGVRNTGYVDIGPADAPAVLLLHGWPYDIYSFFEVTPLLAAEGFRVIVPYLRGYGTTTFRSADAVHNGQQAALAHDAIDVARLRSSNGPAR